ncbi:Nudix hydrolase domain-containing protein [Acetobacteraceae bacterium EV16G]|uniref:GDP-mannose pyrophosphatase n=1 Tax=Sorlinia euscelidii TaxID=3081148 RepID=A0ABU7U012_9PROT
MDENEAPLPKYEVISTRMAYQNPWTAVREDIIRRPNGKKGLYGVVERGEFVVILPLGHNGVDYTVTLVRQYRYPIDARLWELPMGMWETRPDVAPEVVAAGELQEETGLVAKDLLYAGSMWQGAGYSTQKGHIYLAKNLTQGPVSREETEDDLTCHTVTLAQFEDMIARQEISCMVSLAAYARIKAMGLL